MATIKKANGFYSHSDSYLRSMNKQDLIDYIRTIEKNWENSLITNDIQYANCKRLLAEEQSKAIDEFVKLADECSGYTANCIEHDLALTIYTIHQIAEQLKEIRNED